MRTIRSFAVAAVAAATLFLAGCVGASAAPVASTAPAVSGELTVSAAASLKGAFDEIAREFSAAYPAVGVVPFTYDGSSTLATQIIGGNHVDVFASADKANMQKVVDAGLATGPQLFATNTLVIVVPKGNPAGITGLADLAKPGTTVVLCAPGVPCGTAAQTLLANAGVTVTPASQEQNVTAVLTKVANGEADAGIVYTTDAKANSNVQAIVPAGADKVVNQYPIVALDSAADAPAAAAFVAFVLGPDGQAVLAKYGFGAP
ncbi:molybdate ABC transporter substrate-binding protein [Microbacterium sp. X-17]|uniref:molybdate ABC transporter substrate-binding protein n=1 Tax=Microbacterium sp. X-17 TaxID=3144404 RepID=UPI0031F49A47